MIQYFRTPSEILRSERSLRGCNLSQATLLTSKAGALLRFKCVLNKVDRFEFQCIQGSLVLFLHKGFAVKVAKLLHLLRMRRIRKNTLSYHV